MLDASEVLEAEVNPLAEAAKLQEGPAIEGRAAAQGMQAAEDAEALAAKAEDAAVKAKAGAEGRAAQEMREGVQAAEEVEAAAKAKAGTEGITHKSKYWHADYVDDLSSTQMILGVQTSGKGSTTLGSASKTEAWKAGMAWVGENPKPIYNESNKLIGYSSVDKSKAFRLHYKPRDGMTRANFQEFTPVPQRQNAMAEVKNVHIDILDE